MPSRKVTLNHVNQALNDEIHLDFTFWVLTDKMHIMVHFVDLGTGFSEGAIVQDRNGKTIIDQLDTVWVYYHGCPVYISGDDEFNRSFITR